MPRKVELRNDADASIASVEDEIVQLCLRVELTIRGELGELWRPLTLDAKARVIREVHMQDIQLARGHAIDVSADQIERHELPRAIDHEPAP